LLDPKVFARLNRDLLSWYDAHQRSLPWRAETGVVPKPYYVWLSEIMLQQTTVATVTEFFGRFIQRWPTLNDLASATLDEIYHQWQGLGYYSRAKNLHECAKRLQQMPEIPRTPQELIQLPGIGPYTAASIAAIAYDFPIVPVDGNITRVFSRLQNIMTPLPKLKDEIFDLVQFLKPVRPGDFAQALMDLGSTICTPRTPNCEVCPIQNYCQATKNNTAHIIPVKATKAKKPTRFAYAYWHTNDQGHLALIKRPEKGLLANLMALPTSDWVDCEQKLPVLSARETLLPGEVKHTFTHFHLIIRCIKGGEMTDQSLQFYSLDTLKDLALPTLMTKIISKFLSSKI